MTYQVPITCIFIALKYTFRKIKQVLPRYFEIAPVIAPSFSDEARLYPTDKSMQERAWWRHQMETFSALLAIGAGNSPVTGEFPVQRPVTRRFDVFFDLRLNKRLSKQSLGWWFETPSCPLWCHRSGIGLCISLVWTGPYCLSRLSISVFGHGSRGLRLILAVDLWNINHRQGSISPDLRCLDLPSRDDTNANRVYTVVGRKFHLKQLNLYVLDCFEETLNIYWYFLWVCNSRITQVIEIRPPVA